MKINVMHNCCLMYDKEQTFDSTKVPYSQDRKTEAKNLHRV